MSYTKVIKYIKDNHIPTIPIILTGYQDFTYAKQAISYNAFDYVLKPIEKEEFEALLKRVYLKFEKEKLEKTLFQNSRMYF